MIKRIIKFIPKSEYLQIYDALFKSHLSYCISCWGAIPSSKLQGLFSIQKRHIRLLFGLEYSFDHPGYYETCARVRTYQDHRSKKNYCLEHTKPLFDEHKIFNVFNLHTYHTFIDTFKILKTRTPISLYSLFNKSERDSNFLLIMPKVKLSVSQNNFLFKSCSLWNSLVICILEKSLPNDKGIVVRGSSPNSDLCATIPFVKNKLKTLLFELQSSGDSLEWVK